jgi:hypothetical protein
MYISEKYYGSKGIHKNVYSSVDTSIRTEISYSLRPILLFANTDVSITKMYLDTSILVKSIMGGREYKDAGSRASLVDGSLIEKEEEDRSLFFFF